MSVFKLLSHEARAAWKDAQSDSERLRRFAVRALFPSAAVFGAGCGALCLRKRSDPPEVSARFLQLRSGFQCAGREDLSLPDARTIRRSLREAGANLSAVFDAARRLRLPIERDLVNVERSLANGAEGSSVLRRQELYAALVAEWRATGGLDELASSILPKYRHGIDIVTQRDESYGQNIGCEVPLCLLQSHEDAPRAGVIASDIRSLRNADIERAADALSRHGVVLLQGLVPPDRIRTAREQLHVPSSALDQRAASAKLGIGPVRDYPGDALEEEDPELMPINSSPGRRHFYLRGGPLEAVIGDIQAGAMPLVWEHLTRMPGFTARTSQPYVSEVQLIISDPCALDQFWHIDNAAHGLTLFVPLTQVSEDLGPTLFLPGSHHLFQNELSWPTRLSNFAESFFSCSGVPAGTMAAGDALLYDARVMHRCAANKRYERVRVALVFRYDFERPPGFHATGTALVAKAGSGLAKLQRIYAALP